MNHFANCDQLAMEVQTIPSKTKQNVEVIPDSRGILGSREELHDQLIYLSRVFPDLFPARRNLWLLSKFFSKSNFFFVFVGFLGSSDSNKGESSVQKSFVHTGYYLHEKREFGEWRRVEVPANANSYTLTGLQCGTRYQVYVSAFNQVGASQPSDAIPTKTLGQGNVAYEFIYNFYPFRINFIY